MKRNPIEQILVSFIPRHVGNNVVLTVYHLLALIPVPPTKRKTNHDHNTLWLKDDKWDFLTVPSAYIENQNEWGKSGLDGDLITTCSIQAVRSSPLSMR